MSLNINNLTGSTVPSNIIEVLNFTKQVLFHQNNLKNKIDSTEHETNINNINDIDVQFSKVSKDEINAVLEKSLEDLLKFMRVIKFDSFQTEKLDEILLVFFDCAQYLIENNSNICKSLLESFLEYLLNIPDDEDDLQFNFNLNIYSRFGSLKCNLDLLTTLLINKIETCIMNIKTKKCNPLLTFLYEFDISCCSSFLLLLDELMKINKSGKLSEENEQKIFSLMDEMENVNHFNALSYLIRQIVNNIIKYDENCITQNSDKSFSLSICSDKN